MERRQTIFRHNGYEMRSHAEQRWASIMDVLGVRWVYETRTIDTRHGWYMPDFYLPACGVFVEVKGACPKPIEIEKAKDAEAATGCPVVFAFGDPEMLSGHLLHGMLSYYADRGVLNVSTYEVGKLVSENYSLSTYASFLSAGDRKPRPHFVPVGWVVAELVDGMTERAPLEQAKRRIHQPLNDTKESAHGQHSLAEWFICQFVAAVDRYKQQEAA